MMDRPRRRVCFVSGTRAEFGLMRTALLAIQRHPRLALQIVATGMHLDPSRGDALAAITSAGFEPDAVVPWPADGDGDGDGRAARVARFAAAFNTGTAIAHLARDFQRLEPHVALVVGDRVEAFAAAAAGHLCGLVVAHVHGGDRALGQVDDSLRHAITKLAHLHLPATAASARRILRLGEDPWRIRRVGSPGNDGIAAAAEPRRVLADHFPRAVPGRYALVALHPETADAAREQRHAARLLRAVLRAGLDHAVVLYPNTDPGAAGIVRAWRDAAGHPRVTVVRDLPRGRFLGLLRDAALLVGNSSSGIIEAAAFATPVLDVGSRQAGRERSANVRHCGWAAADLLAALRRLWRDGRPLRKPVRNVYGGNGAGKRLAETLASIDLARFAAGKLIRY